jgi:hypothetical protein
MTFLAVILEFSRCRAPDLQSAPLKLVYLALAYGAAMGVANLLYSLGPLLETRLQPARVAQFRHWVFGLGLGISMVLPMAAPVIFLVSCR